MSLVQMGDYPVAFFTEEVVGLAVTDIEPDQCVLRIYLRNSEPLKIVSARAHVEHLFNATVRDLCGANRVRKLDLSPDDAPGPGPQPPTRLAVTMPDGTVIKHKNASDTFVEAIDELGRRKVKNLDLKVNGKDLMSTSEDDQQRRKLGGYLINVGISTERKKRVLEDIASRLDVELNVEIIPK